MSKIKNQYIRIKLQEVLNKEGLLQKQAQNKLNDEEALKIIFACLEDQVYYYQQQVRHTNLLNSELKVIELELRAQLRSMEIKIEQKIQAHSNSALSQNHKKQMEQFFQKCNELESKIAIQRDQKLKLQSKIYELQLKIATNLEQIQSNNLNQDFHKKQIQSLNLQKVDLIQQHQKDIQKYKKEFIEELNKKMDVLSEVENQKFEMQMRPLRRESNEMKKQLSRLQTYVNRMLSLKNTDENWVDQVQKKYNEFERGVNAAIQRQIKIETNQSDFFLQNQKNKLYARKYLLNKHLNK